MLQKYMFETENPASVLIIYLLPKYAGIVFTTPPVEA
jgi:hypothetical protein